MELAILLFIAFGVLVAVHELAPSFKPLVVILAFLVIVAIGPNNSMDGVLATLVYLVNKSF